MAEWGAWERERNRFVRRRFQKTTTQARKNTCAKKTAAAGLFFAGRLNRRLHDGRSRETRGLELKQVH